MYPIKQLVSLLLSLFEIAAPFAAQKLSNDGEKYMYEWSSDLEFSDEHFVEIEKTPGKDFKILNLTDIQLYDSDIYEKDYSAERKAYHAMRTEHGADEAFDLIKSRGIMAAIDKRFLELPHVINPAKKLAYDKCLQMLDSWAMLKGANIRGTVDYVHFDAHIEMVCHFFEFFEERTFEYLRSLMSGARNITFTPTDDGEIKMRACFDYFEDIGDKDKIIEEEIAKHTDVVDALNEAADIDRKIIMSDPIMSAFITQAADEIGITADEYLDRFEELMDENPMTILSLLHNEFHKRAEGIAPPEDDAENE